MLFSHRKKLNWFDVICSWQSLMTVVHLFPSLSLFSFFLFVLFFFFKYFFWCWQNIWLVQLTLQVCTKLFHNFLSFLNHPDVTVFWYLFFLLRFLEIPDDVPYLRTQNSETHNDYIIRSLSFFRYVIFFRNCLYFCTCFEILHFIHLSMLIVGVPRSVLTIMRDCQKVCVLQS